MTAPKKHSATSGLASSRDITDLSELTSALQVFSLRTFDELDQIGPEWNRLVESSRERLPMSSYACVRSFLEYQLADGESWRCLVARAGGELVGVLPLVESNATLVGIGKKQLRAPGNLHLPSVTAHTRQGSETPVLGAFLKELSRTDPNYFSLAFARTHADAAIHVADQTHFDHERIITNSVGNGAYLPISGDYASYFATLGANHRRNMRRWSNRLAQLKEVEYKFLVGEDASDEAAEQFFQLEASGWKGAQQSAILSCPKRRDFYFSMVSRLREAGWLELHLLTVGGKPIAGQMAMRLDRTLVIWKIAYDESYAHYGPGNLLFQKGLEQAFAEKVVEEVNCLTDMPWHKAWKLQYRPYYDVYIYPKRVFSYFAGVVPRRARSFIKQLPGLRPLAHLIRTVFSA